MEAAPDEPESINLTAELRLCLAEGKTAVLRYSESGEAFSLDIMMVPARFRGGGLGSLLLRRLLHIADALGKPVLTVARPLGGGNSPGALDRLVGYYLRFGFEPVQRGLTTVHMRRPPIAPNARPRSVPEDGT